MLFHESRIRAAAKTRRLALGLVCVLAASGALAAISPGHECGAPGAMTCECCQSSGTRTAPTVGGSSCCDAPAPTQPAPAGVEVGSFQRFEDSDLDESREGDAGSRIQGSVLGSIDEREARVAGPHAYILLCTFLI
jgi:hypothetical protein